MCLTYRFLVSILDVLVFCKIADDPLCIQKFFFPSAIPEFARELDARPQPQENGIDAS